MQFQTNPPILIVGGRKIGRVHRVVELGFNKPEKYQTMKTVAVGGQILATEQTIHQLTRYYYKKSPFSLKTHSIDLPDDYCTTDWKVVALQIAKGETAYITYIAKYEEIQLNPYFHRLKEQVRNSEIRAATFEGMLKSHQRVDLDVATNPMAWAARDAEDRAFIHERLEPGGYVEYKESAITRLKNWVKEKLPGSDSEEEKVAEAKPEA